MRSVLSSIVFFLFIVGAYSQTDQVFWFAAPDISSQHGNPPRNGAPLNLHITATYATHVKVSKPADPTFIPIEFDLNQLEHRSIQLDAIIPIDQIETYPDASLTTGMQNKGFLIEASPGEVTAYYELDQYWNRDIFPLKGKNALGKSFRVTTQNAFDNGNYGGTAWSGFVIVATEDNTTVTVSQNAAWLYFPAPGSRTIVLNKGQTFAFRAASTLAANHIKGVKVTSDKDIAITMYDDSMKNGGCYDVFGDQNVPENIVGQEYIVMKGYLTSNERIFITATLNSTAVYVDGILKTTINAGQVYNYLITNHSTHVWMSKPAYVNHITGFGCEMGGAVLPTIDGCTGSHDVTFTRTPNSLDQFYVNIMVRNDTVTGSPFKNKAIESFTMKVGGVTLNVPSTYFEYIQDSAFAVLKDDPAVFAFFANNIGPGDEVQVSNSVSRFHLGVINGGASTGCKYGYFSDYAASKASAGLGGATAVTQDVYCDLDPIQLVASGGIGYQWSGVSDPALSQQISDTTIAAPYFFPTATGDFVFSVKVFGECFTDTTIYMLTRVYIGPTSDFNLSEVEGCSPFSPIITNTTDTNYADKMVWLFENPTKEINQDTIPLSFQWTFPENNTDTIQTHKVKLYSFAPFNSCRSLREKTVKVKPKVKADFIADDTIGCHPLIVNFQNNSTGHLDSTSYLWDFGDNTQSFDSVPVKTYSNYGLVDTIYQVKLLAESPLGCNDSSYQNIIVHPRVRAAMAIPVSSSCSPLIVDIDPGNSRGVDTFYWHIDYKYADSLYTTQSYNTIHIEHQDTSVLSGPDTLSINLMVINRMGCTDSFPEQKLVVYPQVTSNFDVSSIVVCDSVPIQFTNNSFGYQLFHSWDFDDGTIQQDTVEASYTKFFYNRSDKDTLYHVVLRSTSGYLCESEKDTFITVHPYINANFGLDFDNNCVPLIATLKNQSIRAHFSEWDFGDGSPLDNSVAPSLIHTFWNNNAATDTSYVIKLTTRNNEGCTDTIRRSIFVFPHVVSAFSLVDEVGCSPRTVTFQNNSTGGLLSYLWDFGNSTSSTNSNPVFTKTFNNLGQYDTTFVVTLIASNPYGCDSTTTDSVEVFASIQADFSLPISDSCSPFTIRPVNLSSAGVQVFEWDLGPQGTSSLKNPVLLPFTNTTLIEDTINISLIAYGQNDLPHKACADTHTLKVVIYPEMDVDFNLDKSFSCQPFVSAILNQSNIKPGTTFQWRLDANFYSSAENPLNLNVPNLNNLNSNHKMYLLGETNHGCTDSISKSFIVYSLVDSKFTTDKPGICSGDSFQIDRSTSRGGIVGYNWNFNGESTSLRTDAKFYQQFDNLSDTTSLSKFVTLVVKNAEGCDSAWTQNVNVFPKVTTGFSFDDNTVCYPYNTLINNTTQNAHSYFWDFGDGSGSNNKNPKHIFENFDPIIDQTFSVNLIARSNYNCYDSLRKNITIYAKPNAEFYFPITVDCSPFNAQMVNQSIGSGLTYQWNFAGLGSSTAINPSFEFNNETMAITDNPITLLVKSNRLCTDTLTKNLRVYPKVNVDFTQSDDKGCSPLIVDFSGQTTNATKLFWYIDEKPFSTLNDAQYRFVNDTPDDFTHSIKFIAYSLYNCVDSITKTVQTFPSPTSEFIPDPLLQDYNTLNDRTRVTFNNETFYQNNWNYQWNYGDGTINTQASPAFDYEYGDQFWGDINNDNKVRIKLLAWNSENPECRDSVEHDIIINPPFPVIDLAEDLEACVPYTVDFSAFTKYVYAGQYEWDFGDNSPTSAETNPTHTYSDPGVYSAKLIVRGDGGTNWDYKIIYVDPKPEVDFTFNDSLVFTVTQTRGEDYVNFYNLSKFAQSYAWYFEDLPDGSPDSENKDPEWHYQNSGIYYVTLVATSDKMCLDTFTHPQAIHVMGEGKIQFPNAIMVNPDFPGEEWVSSAEDPRRDLFRPYTEGVVEYKLEIYNRWGVLVFTSHDVNHGWNGYIDGSSVKQDVFLYRATGRFSNSEPFKVSGDVTVILAPDEGQLP